MGNPFDDWSAAGEWVPAPEDIILPRVQRLLASDPTMQHFFGDAIEWVPDLGMPEYTRPPRLQIAYGFVGEEDASPTQLDRRDVRVVIRIRAMWDEWSPTLRGPSVGDYPDYVRPGLATLEHAILQILKDNADLTEVVEGTAVALVQRGPVIGPFVAAGGEQDSTSGGTIWFRDAAAVYGVDLDRRTGKIRSIAAAGG